MGSFTDRAYTGRGEGYGEGDGSVRGRRRVGGEERVRDKVEVFRRR